MRRKGSGGREAVEREGALGGLRGSEGGRGHGCEGFGGCVGSRDRIRRSAPTASLINDNRLFWVLVEISETVATARGESWGAVTRRTRKQLQRDSEGDAHQKERRAVSLRISLTLQSAKWLAMQRR